MAQFARENKREAYVMSRAELKAAAKAQIKGNIGIIFLCCVIMYGIGFAAGYIAGPLGTIVSLVITPSFTIGLTLIFLGLTEGKKAEVGTLFKGFHYFGKALWLSILIFVFIFLWALLLYIPGIIKSYSYSMAYNILAEHPEMTAREALRESKAIMHGHKGELFVLYLSFIPWILLCVVTLGIGMIYVVPYVETTITNFYQQIKRQPQTTEENVIPEADMI